MRRISRFIEFYLLYICCAILFVHLHSAYDMRMEFSAGRKKREAKERAQEHKKALQFHREEKKVEEAKE